MREVILAEEEYRRHPDLKKEDVQELAEWMKQHPEYPTQSEEMVIRFLFSCYFNMEDAKKCVKSYFHLRLNNPHLFFDRDIQQEELQDQLKVVQYGVLPEKDPNGSVVVIHRLQEFEPPRYVFKHSCRLLSMVTDALLNRDGNITGLIMIFDMQGVSLGHVFRLKLHQLRLFFQYVQEGNPLRLKGVHVVNSNPLANKIMFLIRPFMKKELYNMIYFHSSNHEEGIHTVLPKACLPKEYGGTQKSFNELHEDFKKWMLEYRDKFVEEDEEIRQFIKSRNNEQFNSSNGTSGKKHEID